jgi:hypothetical protein
MVSTLTTSDQPEDPAALDITIAPLPSLFATSDGVIE